MFLTLTCIPEASAKHQGPLDLHGIRHGLRGLWVAPFQVFLASGDTGQSHTLRLWLLHV